MRTILFLLLMVCGVFCFAQEQLQPVGSTVIETVDGDLDGDKIPEKVIVYNTKDTTDMGNMREIQILKKVNGKWTILEKSRNAVMESRAGGMMGDPYGETKIEKGILIISQNGGSSWKWNVTDKYRYQNGHFELIGTSSTSGRPGDYWKDIDFNLSTGQLNYSKEVENTAEYGKSLKETYIKKGVKINLQNRNQEKQQKIVLPKTKEEVYF
ncbi:Uncharacterised protein [Chryseobacterium gleum]|uniref:Uncharacterized protein n=2 Tax=Chryseobacterium gleum TaxID=250 RepID=A0A3S4MAW0_CHRGE|nr:hypothetical protein [Chryseobacterium gleum]QQY31551.1 hypothetical protein I6I60_22265 [Chryseobacterium gleum]VEE11671.1 Uncharacterised protein [Chryseobacterium gleum]